jgi:hypothetical protein
MLCFSRGNAVLYAPSGRRMVIRVRGRSYRRGVTTHACAASTPLLHRRRWQVPLAELCRLVSSVVDISDPFRWDAMVPDARLLRRGNLEVMASRRIALHRYRRPATPYAPTAGASTWSRLRRQRAPSVWLDGGRGGGVGNRCGSRFVWCSAETPRVPERRPANPASGHPKRRQAPWQRDASFMQGLNAARIRGMDQGPALVGC